MLISLYPKLMSEIVLLYKLLELLSGLQHFWKVNCNFLNYFKCKTAYNELKT